MALALPKRITPEPVEELRVNGATLRFYLGDCVSVLPGLPRATASVAITSPPYNLGIKYRSYADDLPRGQYLAWTEAWMRSLKRVLAPEASFFLNVGSKPTDPWIAMDVALVGRKQFALQNTLHWVKSIAIDAEAAGKSAGLDKTLAVGHYKPINSERFVNDCHEFVFHFSPEGRTPLDRRALGVPYQDASNIARWQGSGAGTRCRGNAWFIPYDTIQKRDRDRPHPATFPAKLPEFCLRLHGLDRVTQVIDPFNGLGTTAVACAQLGIDYIGIELDETYLAQTVARVREVRGSKGSKG
jgi:site-specific DNA-methyltransferase (adenine-specific)